MPAQIPTNITPYFDDFDENKNFYRTLFKAGYPVQARELTQSQTVLQDQIEKLASRFMKDGDNIVPGEFSLIVPAPYIRAAEITQGAKAKEFEGYKLIGTTSRVEATVVYAEEQTDTDDVTFYVTYESSGETSEYKTFVEGETLETDTPNRYTATVGVNGVSEPVTSDAIGNGSLFKVSGGSYFVNGFMVRNDEQIIALDKYGTTPDYEVGFNVVEEFVSSSEDPSLLDNSQGSSNFAAPGADRLKISLILVKRTEEEVDPSFINLATIVQGNLIGKPDQTIKWSWLYDILAKRTFDESGDYIAEDFPFKVMEYVNSQDVDGLYNPDADGKYPALPDSDTGEPIEFDEADGTYVAKIDSGLAYVQGYECGFKHPIHVYGDKPRDVSFEKNNNIRVSQGYNIPVTHSNSHPDIQNINAEQNTEAMTGIVCYRNFNDGYVGEDTVNMGNRPLETYHVVCDGDIGAISSGTVIYQEGNSAVVTSSTELKRGDTLGGKDILIAIKVSPIPSGIIYPRYYVPESTIQDDSTGLHAVDSTYRLGATTAKFFTELAVIEDTATAGTDWVVGELVRGERSRAVATIETGTTSDIVVVSNIIGEFEPGEEIFQDNKKASILRPGEVAGFSFTDAGDLSTTNTLTVQTLGASMTLTTADNEIINQGYRIIPTEKGRNKLYKFPFVQSKEDYVIHDYRVTTNTGIKGYGVVPTLRITNTLSKTKSFYSTLASSGVDEYSADISTKNNLDSEIVSIADSALFKGKSNKNFIICESFTGDASQQLVSGDVITFVDDEGEDVRKVVLFATKPFNFSGKRSKCKIYLTTTLKNDVTGKLVQRIRVRSQGKTEDSLIYQLPQNVVASLETDPLTTRISYYVFREFVIKLNAGASEVEVDTSRANEFFVGDLQRSNVSIMKTSAANAATLEGTFIDINEDTVDIQDEGKKMILEFSNFAVPAGESDLVVKVVTPVFVENAKAKQKKFHTDVTVTIPQAEAAAYRTISLGKADVFRVSSIMMNGRNVTSRYDFDNGQRDNVYELSRITRTRGGVPTHDLVVTFDYFEHMNEGDFFSVDSYTHNDDLKFGAIPVFQSSASESNFTYLRDCVDFRPIVDSVNSKIATITDGVDAQSSTFFNDLSNGGDAFVPRIPVPGTYFKCDIQYYLPRIDSLFLEKTGALTLVPGTPSEAPVPPSDLATGIRLYDIALPAFTFTTEDVKVKKYNYKRFQMKDIHEIEKRIDRVEELVTLSILEQNAINFNVRDAVTGLDRFKNGIVVDPFEDHSRGDTGSLQYRNSVDADSSTLRAPHFTDQVELEEQNHTDNNRSKDHYVNNDDIITLTYDQRRFLRNPFATRSVNLQPYSVFTYDGELHLTPQIDTWKQIKRRPALVIEDNTLYEAARDMAEEMAEAGIGTVWGDWRTTQTQKKTESTEFIGSGTYNQQMNQRAAYIAGLTAQGVRIQGDMLNSEGKTKAVRVDTTTSRSQQRKNKISTRLNVSTGSIKKTSYGDRVVDVSIANTMRTRPVKFQAYRLKPNTRYYAYFDDIDVSDYCSPDRTKDVGGIKRYFGQPGRTNRGFGLPLISDDVGTLTGMFLVPNGRRPLGKFTNLRKQRYAKNGPTRSFPTGTRTLRFTSDPQNSADVTKLEGFAEKTYTASGVILDKEKTVVSTRVPEFNHVRSVTATKTRVVESQEKTANYFDPLAQTFMVDENAHTDGVFISEIDVFFKEKDNKQGCELYLVTTKGEQPTDRIVPRSRVNKRSNSRLRVVCKLGGTGIKSTTLRAGTTIIGQTSGATGRIRRTVTFNSPSTNPNVNVKNNVYNVVLSDYRGEFVPGEVIERQDPQVDGAKDQSRFNIIGDEIDVTRVDVRALGKDYGFDGTTYDPALVEVQFSDPQLPGGTAATGTVKLDKEGRVYDFDLTDPGSGYIRVPSCTIVDNGSANGSGSVLKVRSERGEDAVEMGVCVSEDGTAATTFRFRNPIYLLPGETYGFVLKSPNSLKYMAWTSKLGENLVGTQRRVVEQPSLGSLFMSQNGGLWEADQTQDIKFEMRRAHFDANTEATVVLQNAPLDVELLPIDAIETNSNTGTGSNLFGDNPKIVEVYHPNHGLNVNDLVEMEGVTQDIGGIPFDEFNDVHKVISCDFMKYTIELQSDATSSERGGGDDVRASINRPYEVIDVYTGAMTFANASLTVENRAATYSPISNNDGDNYRLDAPTAINFDEEYYYNGPRVAGNYLNEANYRQRLQGRRSLETTVKMITYDPKVSPVLDLQRTNATLTRNLIDNPSPDDQIFGPITRTLTMSDDFVAEDIPSTVNFGEGNDVVVDKLYPTIRKIETTGPAGDFDPALFDGGNVSTMATSAGQDYLPETKQNGSVYAKWMSRLFLFENDCDGMELKLSACFYDVTDIKCYFRPRNVGFDGDITSTNWIPFNPEQEVTITDDRGNVKREVIPGLPDNVDRITPRSYPDVDPALIQQGEWQSLTFSVQDLARFDGVAIKIVMTSSNPAKAPLIDDFMLICSE